MSDLQQKLERLEIGESFIFLDRFGQGDLACEVGKECLIAVDAGGNCFRFRVTHEHGLNGPHETVYLGREHVKLRTAADARQRHEVAL